jgi:hypothetical protein
MFIPKWIICLFLSVFFINIILDTVIYYLRKKKEKLEKKIDDQWNKLVDSWDK